MKVVQINTTSGVGSTGKIAVSIAEMAEDQNIECEIIYGTKESKYPHSKCVQSKKGYYLNNIVSKIFGIEGKTNYFSTKRLIHYLEKNRPDLIHIHNIHGHYMHAGVLFKYIKQHNIQVIWTLHDCWAFTGKCPYFTMIGCEKWKKGCFACMQCHRYPEAYIDRTKSMWELKNKWFTGVKNMTIVTPSQWLADLVKQSYLNEYSVKVINNGIDCTMFRPTESDFRVKYDLQDKYIILGVSFGWGKRKGLDVFVELAKRLDERFQIVLVGTNERLDRELPKNMISVHCTRNQKELAGLYSTADVFVNPTREENYPTVNLESVACGTPVITFQTGGSSEMLDETCGSVIACDDIGAMEAEVIQVCTEKTYSKEACLKKAKTYDMNERFKEYIELYKCVER